jgi:putative ABC transport system permease protein
MRLFLQDFRFAARMLRKNPGFTLVAVLTLALGIGANTVIFSVVHSVLLKPLPYPESERLVSISARSFPKFTQVQEQSRTLESAAAYYSFRLSLATSREPEAVSGAHVSLDFFRVFGVVPAYGRTFLPEEQQPGGANVAILSDGFWHSHFAGDPGILGKTLPLDATSVTVVGILPSSFRFPFEFPEPDVWLPRIFEHPLLKPEQVHLGAGYLSIIGRLAPGATVAKAQAELNTINDRYRQQFSNFADAKNEALTVVTLEESLVAGLRRSLLLLLAAVGFVLLIGCANITNLLLARATAREKEIAVRKALGASRARLIRQLLSESLLLAGLGGALGFALAAALLPILRSISPGTLPRVADVQLDGPVLLFSLMLCVVTTALFGLVPAIQAAGRQLQDALKEGVRGSSVSGRRARFRSVLVVAEMAIALILIAGAGLLMKSFAHLMQVNLGFSPHGVMTFPLNLPATRYTQPAQQIEFYRQLLERVRALPDTQSAGLVSFLPLSGGYRLSYFCFEGHVCQGLGKDPLLPFWQVSPGYLDTMRTPLLRGRFFDDHDLQTGAPVAIVNEKAAQHFWPNENALGKHVAGSRDLIQREVVGVVADVKFSALDAATADQLYVPLEQMPYPTMTLVVRSAAQPEPLVSAVRAKIAELDPALPVSGISSMDRVIGASVAQPRLTMQFAGAFAAFALLLASVGMYGVMAYTVSLRKQEMGIRISLGANPRDIFDMVIRQGLGLALAGVVAGILGALALTRLLGSLLFGVRAIDPLVFGAAAVILVISALIACYMPARRATRVDPVVVLRLE